MKLEDLTRGGIDKFEWKLAPRFDQTTGKCEFATYFVKHLVFRAIAANIWIRWGLENLINWTIYLTKEYVIHQDTVCA